MNTGIISVAAITMICYLVAQRVKATAMDNKWLPVIWRLAGAVLGYICILVMPEYPTESALTAITVGIVSGLAVTGSHQIVKQLAKGGSNADN